ncbi:NINE protein [Iningainema tapete]|uniref:NINE protein n=1 Tax=Iningainema tapete BLCC-T55 TaxID=2748662 RepID=A0A8J6XEL8_9CYAN|nr:NINE protein [Iningainema tapete]MBD2772313.1 NINE protein [Iningainema tapete BLCC-T55]
MKSKTSAILICFFVGWLGIHKFYLGNNLAGVLYLLFCWTFIPSIIAFVEFFILAFMSDADFNAKYNKGMAPAGGAVSAQDATKALGDLKKLFDTGVITAEEYEQKRQNLLKSL